MPWALSGLLWQREVVMASEGLDKGKPSAAADRIVVMNPEGYPPDVTQLGMAPRLDSLDGKTVYLVDLHFYDSGSLLEQMRLWFAERMPQVTTVLLQKSGRYMDDDPALFQNVRNEGDAVIVGVGH
jgi:hypothetical protein